MDEADMQIQALVEDGSIKSIQDDNVKFNWPVFRALHPVLAQELWLESLNEVDKTLFSLSDKGLVTIEVQETEDGEFALFCTGLTEKGKEVLANDF